MKWLIGIGVVLVALGALFWWAVVDGAAPARAENPFDLAAYRALVANDAPELLPTAVNAEFVGQSQAPGFAAEAGAFGAGARTFAYGGFQIVAPGGDTVIDGGVDASTLAEMSDSKGTFDEAAYQRLLDGAASAAHVLITHEHLDHVMAIARHPAPAAIAQELRLTRPQLAGLPEHAPNGVLATEIANVSPADFTTPQHIAPGIVAHAMPGHSAGTIAIYVKSTAHEYLFIGDIAWLMSSIEHLRGRPRLISLILPGVDPDRPAVLRQIRALHDLRAAEPNLVILPAHDADYLRGLVNEGIIGGAFTTAPAPASAN